MISVKMPKLDSPDLAEEVGIHIGDGSMNIYGKSHLFSLRGHRFDDKEYYENFIPTFYKKVYDIDVHVRYWPDVIGFQLGSKSLIQFKHNVLGLPLGPKKSICIPSTILSDKRLASRCIRGIFDTDGTICFEKKGKEFPYYPRIIIATTSRKLKDQMVYVLKEKLGFNLSFWKETRSRYGWSDLYRICVRGESNTKKWFKIIGSNNPKNIVKYQYWKKYSQAPVAQR